MTLFVLKKPDEAHLVRAKDEHDARMLLVEKKQDLEWADDDTATCDAVFSSGRNTRKKRRKTRKLQALSFSVWEKSKMPWENSSPTIRMKM